MIFEMLKPNNQISGLKAAQYFKYYLQFKFSFITEKIELRRIAAKSFYTKHKKYFDKLVLIFNKYNLDVIKYIEFFVAHYGKLEKDISEDLLNMKSINAFVDHLKTIEKRKQIYKWFQKSVDNISNDCIALDFYSTKDYIRELISSRKLAQYYLTGKISRYWFAAIPNFKKVIVKLDKMSQDEFKDIYDRFDIYNTDINKAFLMMKSIKVNPIRYTDEIIFKKRQQMKKI